MAGTVAVAATRDDSLIEFGVFNMGYLHEFSPSVMLTDNGDHGVNISFRLHYGLVSANAYYRRLWKDGVTPQQKAYEEDRPPLLGGGFEQSNMAVSFPLVTGTMTYRYNENRQDGGQTTYTNDVDYRVSLLNTSDYTIDMSVGFSRSGDNDVAMMSFEFRLRDDRWTWQATPRVERRKTNNNRDTSENLRVAASWDDLDLFESTVRVAMGAETGSDGERYDGRLTMGNSWGKGDLNFTHVVGDTDSSTSYAASFNTSFLTDGKHMAMGGNNQAESALVINVSGKKGDIFEVNIDGQRRGYAVAGRPSVIPLAPYKQYRVSLKQSALVLSNIDEGERMVTLYPGNVVSMDYESVTLKLLFGRLLFDGVPMKNVRISGGQHPAESDDVGLFQLESLANVRTLNMETDNGLLCTVPVPVPTSDSSYIQQMGTIDLKEADCESIPDEEMEISKQDVEQAKW